MSFLKRLSIQSNLSKCHGCASYYEIYRQSHLLCKLKTEISIFNFLNSCNVLLSSIKRRFSLNAPVTVIYIHCLYIAHGGIGSIVKKLNKIIIIIYQKSCYQIKLFRVFIKLIWIRGVHTCYQIRILEIC